MFKTQVCLGYTLFLATDKGEDNEKPKKEGRGNFLGVLAWSSPGYELVII